jgi:hypothetical protein
MLRYSLYSDYQIREPDLLEPYSSENSSAAENQQERLVRIGWITGFVDGEGCFSIHFVRQAERLGRRGYRTGYQVAHEFAVTQGAKSVKCLHMLRRHFGVGQVYRNRRHDNHKEDLYRFSIVRRNDLMNVIIPFFEKYPLRTSHLTASGVVRIAEITETMNHCKPRTEMIRILRDYTPNTGFRR